MSRKNLCFSSDFSITRAQLLDVSEINNNNDFGLDSEMTIIRALGRDAHPLPNFQMTNRGNEEIPLASKLCCKPVVLCSKKINFNINCPRPYFSWYSVQILHICYGSGNPADHDRAWVF